MLPQLCSIKPSQIKRQSSQCSRLVAIPVVTKTRPCHLSSRGAATQWHRPATLTISSLLGEAATPKILSRKLHHKWSRRLSWMLCWLRIVEIVIRRDTTRRKRPSRLSWRWSSRRRRSRTSPGRRKCFCSNLRQHGQGIWSTLNGKASSNV